MLGRHVKGWLPEDAAGKIQKRRLREQFRDYRLATDV